MLQNTIELDFDPDDDPFLLLHPRLGLRHPLSPFQAALFSPCCHGGTPTPVTPSPTGGVQPSEKPQWNKESGRNAEDALEWAVGEGIGEDLSVTDSNGSGQP